MPTRPTLRELSRSECLDRLGHAAFGRVGVSVDALPAIFPVFLAVVDGVVVFRTPPGTKLAAAGGGEIVAVEVSADGGETWQEAMLDDADAGPWAWRGWAYRWEPEPGEYELCCRARDSAGNEQPVEPEWNLGGYVNNAVQRIPVTVV